MKIKICGLSRPEDIAAANELLPDYIGFVFAKSRRQVSGAQAAALREQLDPRIAAVGVFVNAPAEEIVELVRAGVIDLVQLHGDEDTAYMERLRGLLREVGGAAAGAPIIKAVRVGSWEEIEAAAALPCEYLLLDACAGGQYGGSGRRFDWGLIPEKMEKPWFLAGGIGAAEIPEALRMRPRPFCLDVSSAAETDGVKDAGKMRELVRLARCGA